MYAETSTSSENAPRRKKRTRTDAGSMKGAPRAAVGGHRRRLQLFGRGLVAKSDDRTEPGLVARRQRLEARVRDLAVRNADDGPIERADPRRAQADVVDGADDLAHLQKVADADRLVEDQRCAGDDVFECLLRGEGDGDAADAESGQRWCRIDAEQPQRARMREEDDQRIDRLCAEHGSSERAAAVVGFEIRRLMISFDLAVQQNQQPRDRDNGEQPRGLDQNCRISSDSGSCASIHRRNHGQEQQPGRDRQQRWRRNGRVPFEIRRHTARTAA